MRTSTAFAGNSHVKDGIAPAMPIANLSSVSDPTTVANLEKIAGLYPAKGTSIIMETRVPGDMFGDCVNRINEPFGAFSELATFVNSPASKKRNGKCYDYGTAELYGQAFVSNWAYNVWVTIKDREINRAVMSESEAMSYIAKKTATPLATLMFERNARIKEIIANVRDGTRTIESNTSSDGTGNVVTVTTNIVGYAGKIEQTTFAVPELTYGEEAGALTGEQVVEVLKKVRNASTWMQFASNVYAKGLQSDDSAFTLSGTLDLYVEKAFLDALDFGMTSVTDTKYLGRTAREWLAMMINGRIVEIDKHESLPESAGAGSERLLMAILDRESIWEFVNWEDVEAQRCVGERSTSINHQGQGSVGVFMGVPSYALLSASGSE